ncbi:MAG: NAD-dependent epimerase/dehydratase family protein, partial [Caldiserica bacterium]|nr:NAD-dependent epimerase/dehydratase family protein [Caldisericota bacterium]
MILVTGATGHIGNVLVAQLNTLGIKPRVLVLPSEDIEPIRGLDVEIVQGDVLDKKSLEKAFDQVSSVFHLAGLITIMPGKNETVRRVNVEGTKNIIDMCFKHLVKRLVYVSSIHALKRISRGKVMDENLPFDSNNPYGAYDRSKAEASLLVQDAISKGLDAVIVCPTGVIGPFDYRVSEMGQLVVDCLKSNNQLYIDGAYDFVDVRDAACGMIQACQKGRKGQTYILSGHKTSVLNFIQSVKKLSSRKIRFMKVPFFLAKFIATLAPAYYKLTNTKPRFTPYSIEVLQSNCDISHEKASSELGYTVRPFE